MNVKLVWITPDAEKLIGYIARVSSPDNQNNPDYAKLIKYLLKQKHWSPFEMACACFEIKTSRAVSQQMLRHRSFSFQEFSQRYAEVTEIEPIEIRKQATKNRQSSEEVFDPTIYGMYSVCNASALIDNAVENLKHIYKQLIEAGVAKECARMILPMATQTTIYMTGNIRSWLTYLALRTDAHTQKEHQLIALEIEQQLREKLPTIYEAMDALKTEGWTLYL